MICNINYILKNIIQFAKKSTMIFVLFIICEISAVLIILFSFGSFNHFQAQKEIESKKIDQMNFNIAFGNIVDTIKDESGKILYYNGDGTITVDQFRQVLNKLDNNIKSRLPGYFFSIDNNDSDCLKYFNNDESVTIIGEEESDVLPPVEFRLEFNEDLNDYSLYNEYLNNFSMNKGRFFTYEEYAGNQYIIVLPLNGKKDLLGKNIYFFGKKYKVIGFTDSGGDIQIPFKTVSGDHVIKNITLLDDNVIMTQDYYKLKKAFISIMGNQVLFPPVDTVDLSEVKYYNSIMFISLALAVASAINLAILFRYVINSRNKKSAVFLLNGCTKNKIRRMYILEVLIISVIVFILFSNLFHFVILSKLTFFFDYIKEVYNFKTYILMFFIFISSIYLFLNVVIIMNYQKNPVTLLKERGR